MTGVGAVAGAGAAGAGGGRDNKHNGWHDGTSVSVAESQHNNTLIMTE